MLARMFGARIDYSCSLHPKAKIDCPWNLTMSERSSLGENSWTYALAPIRIGKNVCIGKDVYLLTGSHDVTRKSFDLITKPIEIGDECWVATDATVMPGVKLAGYTVVAAEALVNKNTEPYDIVGGNPAKFIKKREISD